ncbi:glycosyltransferase family 4 protein [Sinomonas albida]|uniref:glycosyltransferase family 4 protein n=1 Tax=Sinomonas albida TaxID=369942 RepID=UPI001F158D3E|nr:glycosyltransferase family 4 protein [Sinomonas albida]
MTPRPATRIDVVGPGAFGWRSGGTTYNQRLMAGLRELGVDVREHVAPGAWPEGSAADRAALSALLRGIAADGGGAAIVDGLVGLGCPDELREAERAGVAVWVLVHSSLVDLAPSGTPDAARLGGLERAALTIATGVLAPSEFSARRLTQRYGVSAAVARPGAETAAEAHGSRPARIVCVAALLPGKGQLILLEALERLVDVPWNAVLIGSDRADASYARQVRQAASLPPLAPRVTITGELSGAELEDQWLAADLSVLPSASETFGLTVVDSLSHGVPALVAAGTGAEEALGLSIAGGEGLAGAAAALRSADVLEQALRAWLTDRALCDAWRAAARAARPVLPGWDATARAVLDAVLNGRAGVQEPA